MLGPTESSALETTEEMTMTRYVQPGWFTRNVFNRAVRGLTRLGVSVAGSRELRVRGRKSGEWRTTPVNLLTVGDERYLVAPRGTTHWVRNLRAAGDGELRVGRRTETFRASELDDAAKPVVLREYLRRWAWEAGAFFEGVGKDATDADLARIAPDFPVFLVHPTA
jgi:deazaflavin-dependent oxidoreductase (nitroreductase family)